jgi:peptidoglycan/xylan/chitin deacetylase (PgdA/CDA1 family)
VIYLTFDDGPIPEITKWVLDELIKFNAQATFFCVGENIKQHPDIFERIIAQGHGVANHTMNHLKGFSTSTEDYLKDVDGCKLLVKNNLFRPPYGLLKPSQYKQLLAKNYNLIMWDVISYDYEKISEKTCLNNVIKNTKNGSIVLFHDSVKSENNLKYALPLFLSHFTNLGYTFKKIEA